MKHIKKFNEGIDKQINTIPTAERIVCRILEDTKNGNDVDYLKENPEEMEYIAKPIIEFAKLHVKAALEAAYNNADVVEGWNTGFTGNAAYVKKDSIINAYPESNIK